MPTPQPPFRRRDFLKAAAGASSLWGVAVTARQSRASTTNKSLEVGQAEVDTTPPLGIELAGFHRSPGSERIFRGIRQPTAARAIVLRLGEQTAALVSLDIILV